MGKGTDDVDLESDQLRCKLGDTIVLSLRKSVLDVDGLSLDISEIAKCLLESLNLRIPLGRSGSEQTHPREFSGLLRLRRFEGKQNYDSHQANYCFFSHGSSH